MQARATARYIRIAPRKARVVVDLIRGKFADEALEILQFTRRRAARPVAKVLRSAIANAATQFEGKPNELYVAEAYVDQGPVLRRWRPRARGMAGRIRKGTSHITVVVAEAE